MKHEWVKGEQNTDVWKETGPASDGYVTSHHIGFMAVQLTALTPQFFVPDILQSNNMNNNLLIVVGIYHKKGSKSFVLVSRKPIVELGKFSYKIKHQKT